MHPDIDPEELSGNGHATGDPDPEVDPGMAGLTSAEEAHPVETEPLPDAPLRAILESLLFATDEPITPDELTELLGAERARGLEDALAELDRDLRERGGGLRVQRVAGGLRLTTAPELAPWLRELVRQRNRQRLSRAALETLALVAYKQPITAPEIQEIRGVNPNAILGTLLDRRLVRIMGRKKVVGKPFLYGTTREFLIRFGLNALTDLPSMDEFAAMLEEETSDELPFHEDAAAADATAATDANGGGDPEPAPEAQDEADRD